MLYSPTLRKYRFNNTHIRRNNLLDLKAQMGWEGSGTFEDPIIINNIKGLQPNLIIHKSNFHLILRNIKVIKISCRDVDNVIIENCKIYMLDLQGCDNLLVRNNEIMFINLLFTRECYFESNKIQPESLYRLEGTYFDKISRTQYSAFLYVSMGLITSTLISFIYLHWWFAPLFLSPMVSFVYLYYVNKRREFRMRKMKSNICTNNDSLTTYNELTIELIRECQDIKPDRRMVYLLFIIGGAIGGIIGYYSGSMIAHI
ncbi:MAG: hypothetical protein ACFFB0_21300 [Promethearchaeota archaeon]